jgi:hypothetical protein
MASASITLVNEADANVVYSLAGQSESGATFKDVTRSLALPRTLNFEYNLGAVGSKGNDKLVVTLQDAKLNETSGEVKSLRARLEVSVPRDDAIVQQDIVDILCQLTSLLTDARNNNIADSVVP